MRGVEKVRHGLAGWLLSGRNLSYIKLPGAGALLHLRYRAEMACSRQTMPLVSLSHFSTAREAQVALMLNSKLSAATPTGHPDLLCWHVGVSWSIQAFGFPSLTLRSHHRIPLT